jgi:hypothetical protein
MPFFSSAGGLRGPRVAFWSKVGKFSILTDMIGRMKKKKD